MHTKKEWATFLSTRRDGWFPADVQAIINEASDDFREHLVPLLRDGDIWYVAEADKGLLQCLIPRHEFLAILRKEYPTAANCRHAVMNTILRPGEVLWVAAVKSTRGIRLAHGRVMPEPMTTAKA